MRIPIRRVILCLLLGLSLVLAGIGGAAASGTRSSDPVIFTPEASGVTVLGKDPLTVDASNASQGYLMGRYTGSAAKAVLQITGPDGITYKYFLTPSDQYIPLPLTSGDGAYAVDGYENITGTTYATLFKESTNVKLDNEFLPYLYPNQYVLFDADTKAVAVAAETVEGAFDDLEAVARIYHYVVENVSYDNQKAATVTSGYLPVVDDTLDTGLGICFDYAALTAAMLRSQNIPTRLEIGYSGTIYHSWISVYVPEAGWIDRVIEFSGTDWTRMDPTFASSGENSEAILEYIGDGANYSLQYLH